MPDHDFSSLYAKYPSVIARMSKEFTSHEFILELARLHQVPYIEALYAYRHSLREGKPVPFMIVHGILAQQLANYPRLIKQVKKDATSVDIFGQDSWCSLWRRTG